MNIIHYSFVIFLISIFQHSVEGQRNAGCVRPRIENGRAKVRARGKMVYFRCRKKFTRIGPKFAVCLPNSVWSQPAPICIGRGCPTIVPKDGLQISGEYDGAMLKFTCPAGMKREGPESIHCNGKKWNADQPSCVVGISLQCDFEQEELCGWSQSDDDDFEWTWLSGKTPTVNTGPLRDHTHASNSTGHYLFIESSSPRKPLDRAVLASPLYQAKYSDTCFEFWYHMQGPDEENAVGSLEVFVKPESLTINDIDPEFIMEGNQGADWKRGTIYIEGQTEVFQIIIVGTRKEAFVSDIAIDDVRMYNCSEDSLTTAEADEMTTESESSSPDVQSSIITQKITSTTISKPSATTKAVNGTTRKPTTAVTKQSNIKTTSVPTTARLTPKKTPTTIRKTTPMITTSMKTTPEPKTTPIVRTTKMKTTMSTSTTTKRPTFKSTIPRKTMKTTSRQKYSKTTIKPKQTTVKSTTPLTTMKKTISGKPKSPSKSTSMKAKASTISVNPSTSTPKTNTTRKTSIKQTHITPITDAIKPSTRNTTLSIFSSVSWESTGSTTIPRLSADGNNTVNLTQTDIGIGETQTSVGRTGGASMTPLIIGISCGIAVGLIVIAILAYMWVRRQRNKLSDETIEEMAPITNAEGGYYHPS
ncbi:hypothetical protein LOTGIDRAFT_232036 [Lottia gigantea]|uniref:Sushi domain-containing protein n=1 Tax=Lottia gigantea TaxID=225164 RepID=V4AKV5_LOTGI|nr:hypothetical protein LOTGIDRAFT_232036 [Lottia gigantea]ESO95335.1 hypothetical protein LOTGIDRAFT_232036 [Lottia gigantea]